MYDTIKDINGNKFSIYSKNGKSLINKYIGGSNKYGRFSVSPGPVSLISEPGVVPSPNPQLDEALVVPGVERRRGRFTVSPSPPSINVDELVDSEPRLDEPQVGRRAGRFTMSPSPPSINVDELVDSEPQLDEPQVGRRVGRFTVSPSPPSIVDEPVVERRTGRFTVSPSPPSNVDEPVTLTTTPEEIPDHIVLENNKIIKIKGYIFKLLEKIGYGAQGEVWLADLLNKEDYKGLINSNHKTSLFSIKFMKAPERGTAGYTSLKREIKNLKKLGNKSEFIVKTYDISEVDNYVVILMEYINSMSITEFILQLRLKFRLNKSTAITGCLKLLEQLIKGLKYLHDNNIVHRDIKPDNILLNLEQIYYQGENISIPYIKYIDFGLSCGKYTINECMDKVSNKLPKLGTVIYMATELLRKSPFEKIFTEEDKTELLYSKKTDIYSLGITIYELFHSFTPFQNPEIWATYDRYLPLRFMEERIHFLPIKSKLHNIYNGFAIFDFIINIMVVDDPEMRVDIDLLNSIFDGTYKYIDDIPYIELLHTLGRKEKEKEKGPCECPIKEHCQQMALFNSLPLSCRKVCSESHSWKMAKCGYYIPSIDHLIENNKSKTKEKITDWLRKEYMQHIATDQIVEQRLYNKYIILK
uniref:Protein kinase domain-containing protein n=1 Tax=viral metagenome TaxID=1070528 RepID=A0A6C0EKP3_9ZZZZ